MQPDLRGLGILPKNELPLGILPKPLQNHKLDAAYYMWSVCTSRARARIIGA